MLRTIIVILLILVGLRYSLRGAFYVLLFYLWIAYFRPDAWVWSPWVRQFNLSFIVGVGVVAATVFSKERFRFGLGQLLMLLFLTDTFVSVLNSPALVAYGSVLLPTWTDFARKVIIGFAMVTLVTTEERLRLVFFVIAASLSFEAAKQGWAQLIINPGAVNSNPNPFMGDNNGVAVCVLMLIPMLTALAATTSRKWEKYGARFLMVGVLYRGISTYSRGGFLAAIALGLHYLLRTKRKIAGIAGVIVLAALIAPVLPSAFWERMGTIQTAAEATDESQIDESSAGRLHFWRVAVDMANDRPVLGVGFEAYNYMYDYYDFRNGAFGKQRSVHSAWFGLLAEVGYVGLGIFVLLISRALYFTWKARRLARTRADLANLVIYGTALEAGLVVFAVGGSFVPLQYNEMLWHILALSFVFERLVRERIAVPAPMPAADESMARGMAWPAQPAMISRLPGTKRVPR